MLQATTFGKRNLKLSDSIGQVGRTASIRSQRSGTMAHVTTERAYTPASYVTENSEEVSQEDLQQFVGPNWRKFEAAFSRSATGFTWCWPAFFFPLPWFLYRKMYMETGLLILISALIEFLSIGAFFYLATGLIAKPIYFHRAKRKILEIRNSSTPSHSVDKRISEAGGVSIMGHWIGILIMIFSIVALIVQKSAV